MLELLISILIVTGAMILATDLLFEAGRRSMIEQDRIFDPAVPIALKQLRADVLAASNGSGRWQNQESLSLVHPSGLRVRYLVRDGELLRAVGDPPEERPLMNGVRSFRWEFMPLLSKPILQITIEYEAARTPTAIVVDGEPQIRPRALREEILLLTLRGGGGVGW